MLWKLRVVISYTWTALLAICFIVTIKPAKPMAEQQVLCNGTYYYYNNRDAFITSVKAMRGCTILEGGLHISFLNLNRNSELLVNFALFPNLREISGFLLLHNVSGLESLAELFPNLSVIRGEPPLNDKNLHASLCITDNEDLIRIGINIAVLNGSVHVRGNKKLCPDDEVAVSWIHYPNNVEIDIRRNMPDILKNSTDTIRWCRNNSARAWPTPPSTTCHDQCLGGCTGRNSSDCYVCRYFQYNNECVPKCPENKRLSLPSHLCTDDYGCEQRGPVNTFPNLKRNEESARHLIRNNTCALGCKEPYEPSFEYGFLKCKKPCTSSAEKITSAFELEAFRNCTYTSTTLEIAIPPNECEKLNVSEWTSALERNLGDIKTINGSLHIKRLHGVQNLHFLRSLETINADKDLKYAIFIDNNAALSQLFTETVTNRLKIRSKKGYLGAITFNPMLCLEEISRLNKVFPSDGELVFSENAGRAQCNGTSQTVEAIIDNNRINATSAVVKWIRPQVFPVICITLYFRPAPSNGTVTVLAMNLPSSESWDSLEELQNHTANILQGTFLLKSLNAGSRYAVYIEVVGDSKKMQSKITYFWTKTLRSRPCTVSAWPYPTIVNSESALKIEWAGPPPTQVQNPFEYLITGELVKETGSPCSSTYFRQLSNNLDYCTALKQSKPYEPPMLDRRQIVEPCNPNEFSSYLDKFVKKPECPSFTPPESFPKDCPDIQPSSKIIAKNETDSRNSSGRLVHFAFVSRTEAVVVKNLMPFGNYQIRVYTCSIPLDGNLSTSWELRCSLPSFGSGRSSAVLNADTLLLSPVAIPLSSSSFVLQWGRGKVTNSLAWYSVKITDEKNVPETLCIEEDERTFENKPDGLYNICVTVESMFRSGETRCISYRVGANHPWESFVLVLFGVIGVVIVLGFVIRRIQQYKSEDRVALLREESVDTDMRFSEIPGNDFETVLF